MRSSVQGVTAVWVCSTGGGGAPATGSLTLETRPPPILPPLPQLRTLGDTNTLTDMTWAIDSSLELSRLSVSLELAGADHVPEWQQCPPGGPVSPTVHHQQQSAGESRESCRGWCGAAQLQRPGAGARAGPLLLLTTGAVLHNLS